MTHTAGDAFMFVQDLDPTIRTTWTLLMVAPREENGRRGKGSEIGADVEAVKAQGSLLFLFSHRFEIGKKRIYLRFLSERGLRTTMSSA